jgi:hypothetical protein
VFIALFHYFASFLLLACVTQPLFFPDPPTRFENDVRRSNSTLIEQHRQTKSEVGEKYFKLQRFANTNTQELERKAAELLRLRRNSDQQRTRIEAREREILSLSKLCSR